MKISYTYHTTSLQETLEPHFYIHRYAEQDIKKLVHTYKFNQSLYTKEHKEVLDIFLPQTIDICIDRYLSTSKHAGKGVFIYTSPPSTMYERGEKSIDSMFYLLQKSIHRMFEYINLSLNTNIKVKKVFNIKQKYLKEKQAQHLGKNSYRKNRVKNLKDRYSVSLKHKIYLWYCIRILRIKIFSYTIIDDVSSTGATLVACKETLLSYLMFVQNKHLHISFDVKIVSLCH